MTGCKLILLPVCHRIGDTQQNVTGTPRNQGMVLILEDIQRPDRVTRLRTSRHMDVLHQ
jgi:hypothetical protein